MPEQPRPRSAPGRPARAGAASPAALAWPAPEPEAVEAVVRRLEAEHGTRDLGNKADPIEELVFIPLTRQTHRQNSSRSWEAVAALGGPAALLEMGEEALAALLKDGGFSRQKARWIRSSLEAIVARFGRLSLEETASWSDADVEGFLASLPGIKVKSAKCVMMYSLGRRVLPVDVHLRRLAERLGWVPARLSERRIHHALEEMVPEELRFSLHVNAIWHGRAVCRALAPRCGGCVLRRLCSYGKMMLDPSTPEYGDEPERVQVMEHA